MALPKHTKLSFFLIFIFVLLTNPNKIIAATTISNVQPSSFTPTTATISWTTSEASDSKVEYGTSTSYGSSDTDATSTTSHSISVTDIAPGTTYHYRVGNTAGSVVSDDYTLVAPYDFGIMTTNPLMGVSMAHNSDEYGKGIKFKTLEIAWDQYEGTDGNYNASYIADKKSELVSYQAQGFSVVLELGIQNTPDWVRGIDANALFKNQYGDTYEPNSPGEDVANTVFNNTVRTKLSEYLARVFTELGTDFFAIRLGGGWYGELHYPLSSEAYNGRTNSFWAYDANAQGTGGNLPSGVEANPVPGWIPDPISNGTFENGDDGKWAITPPYDSIVDTGAYNGTKALQKVNPGAWTNVANQLVQVVPGRTYRISGWLKTSNSNANVGIQIQKASDHSEVLLLYTNNTAWTQVSDTFIPTEDTVWVYLNSFGSEADNATLDYDDITITAEGYSYDPLHTNATAFWDWYRDSLINYQNWQITQIRNDGFNGKIFMLFPGYGLRTDADSNWVTDSISYDLSYTSMGNTGGEMGEGVDWGTQVANFPGSDSDVYVYSTWMNSTGTNSSSDKKDWSAAKYLSYVASNNSRKLYGENAGSNSYSQMQTTISNLTDYNYLGLFWYGETQLYGGTYASADNYATEISSLDTTAPYDLSLSINSGASSTSSQSVTLTISALDNVSSSSGLNMMVSENSSFTGASYEPYSTSKVLSLSSYNGAKTIYLKVKDEAGNVSNTYSSSIALNTPASIPSPPVCTDTTPASAPIIKSLVQSTNSVEINFYKADDPVTYYALEYGTSSGNYKYGATDIGGANTTSYTVNLLSPATIYYFRVRAGNGCATGAWSNEVTTTTAGFSLIKPLEEITPFQPAPQPISEETTTQTPELAQASYDVKVKVIDTNKKPVEGATVTLHSNPQTSKTDKDGIAMFNNVEPGEHKVLIAYNGYEGEQSINLTGDVKEFDLNITIKAQNALFSPIVIIVISIMAIVIIILIVLLLRNKISKIRNFT